MFLIISQYDDGSIETTVHASIDKAMGIGTHLSECDDLDFHAYAMWMTVSDAVTGELHALWRRTDDGFTRMYLNHPF